MADHAASTSALVRDFASALGSSLTMADWLLRQGHTEAVLAKRFLAPRLAELTQPEPMLGRKLAAERLARAIGLGQTVCVFGDYDCDGMTATAIMTEMLRALGGVVTPLLANRFAGGYGVSEAALERIRSTKPKVVVTCDCGSSDHKTLSQLTAEGIDVIVIDHHLVPPEPLPVFAFLNPHQPGCGFGYKGLASCGLALSVGAAVRAEMGRTLDVRRWLDLVAIGTIADVAPLTRDNRALVRSGLERLQLLERPGLAALFELAKIVPSASLSGRDVAFRIAPRLNAPGRLGSPEIVLDLLLATDETSARAIAAKIEELSVERKQQQERILTQATEQIEREGYAERAAIVVGEEGWNHGIVGIVAGRLAEAYGKPVIVCGFDGARGRGSVRGPRGFRLFDALSHNAETLVRFGGHQAAAGLEIEKERLVELRAGFERSCADPRFAPAIADDGQARISVSEHDSLLQVVSDLERLEPCGEGNPRPTLSVSGRVIHAKRVSGGHLKLALELARGRHLDCFSLNQGDRAETLQGSLVVASGDLRRNNWRGNDAVEFFAETLAAAEVAATPALP